MPCCPGAEPEPARGIIDIPSVSVARRTVHRQRASRRERHADHADERVERISTRGIEAASLETYEDGVRKVVDRPDGTRSASAAPHSSERRVLAAHERTTSHPQQVT